VTVSIDDSQVIHSFLHLQRNRLRCFQSAEATISHAGDNRHPGSCEVKITWIPASAGMTK
jgi:hypothetical protein